MKTREEQIDEMAKAIYATGVALGGTDYVFGVYADDDHFHRMANALCDAGYRKRDEVIKDVFEGLIEETKAVQRAGDDGLGVEDLKNIAKLWYGEEVEE